MGSNSTGGSERSTSLAQRLAMFRSAQQLRERVQSLRSLVPLRHLWTSSELHPEDRSNHQQTFDMDHVKQALDMLQKDLSPGDLPNFDMVKSAIDMIRAQETYQAQLNNPKKVTVPKIVMYPKSKAKPSAASSSLPEWENVLPI